MKIIHTADLHLDSKMTTHLPPDKARQRRRELLTAFQKMLDFARQHEVKAIIIAGDLFDTKNTSALARNTVYEGIIMNPQITFYYLKGNHDADSFLSGLEEIPDNLKMFGDQWAYYQVNEGSDHKVMIAGIELNFENSMEIYESLQLDSQYFNIVVLHGQEAEAVVRDRAENIKLKALKNKGIDYLALGHIHRYKKEKLDARASYCYAGCLEARGFDESGEHGFVLLDINEKTGEYQHYFIEQAVRKFHEKTVDISGCFSTGQIAEQIKAFLETEAIPAEDMLKLTLTGKLPIDAEKDMDMLNRQFRNDYFFCKIYDKTKWQLDDKEYEKEWTLRGEFIRTVQKESLLAADEKAQIIQYGLMALRGEVIE